MPVTARSRSSAPATETSDPRIGSRAARSPRKTSSSASSRIGRAKSSPRNRSDCEVTALSRMTASSPPTFTAAPGTDPDKTLRTSATS